MEVFEDLQERARRILPPHLFDHMVGGAGEERTQAANEAGFGRYRLRARVLVDVSHVDTSVELFGARLAAPVFSSPTGSVSLIHPDGERGVARACASAGVPFTLNGTPGVTIEDAAAVAGPARWAQLYWQGNRDVLLDLVKRYEDSGYRALVLTVDQPTRPRRPRMIRNGYRVPVDMVRVNVARYDSPEWSGRVSVGEDGRIRSRATDDLPLTWKSVEWLRPRVHVPLLLKGIRTAADAVRALGVGVDGIVVSNHGGRNLDAEPGAIEVLEEVVRAVGGRVPVLVDGGVRRSTDVAIALGLGAAAVGVGRPVVWALACGGESGVAAYLRDMTADLARTFGMLGVARVAELTREYVSGRDEFVTDAELARYMPPAQELEP